MRANGIARKPILSAMPGPWGNAIRMLRLSKPGLTQKALAKRAGMTPTTYGKIEKGRHTHTRKLQHIADVLGVPIELVLSPNPGVAPPLTLQETVDRLVSEALQQHAPLQTIQQKVKELGQFTEDTERAERDAKASKKIRRRKKS